eukprot:scaffold241_cov242-Pinguiococcus_pyrenoidosus.AAC.24
MEGNSLKRLAELEHLRNGQTKERRFKVRKEGTTAFAQEPTESRKFLLFADICLTPSYLLSWTSFCIVQIGRKISVMEDSQQKKADGESFTLPGLTRKMSREALAKNE